MRSNWRSDLLRRYRAILRTLTGWAGAIPGGDHYWEILFGGVCVAVVGLFIEAGGDGWRIAGEIAVGVGAMVFALCGLWWMIFRVLNGTKRGMKTLARRIHLHGRRESREE